MAEAKVLHSNNRPPARRRPQRRTPRLVEPQLATLEKMRRREGLAPRGQFDGYRMRRSLRHRVRLFTRAA